jgi:hypothetical protein
MATASPGFLGQIRVNTGSGFVVVGGVTDFSYDESMAEIDSTHFGDTYNKRVYGLGDATSSLSFIYDGSDAGQTAIRTAKNSRTNMSIEYRPAGGATAGFVFVAICTSIGLSQAVDGRVEGTMEFALADGQAPTAAAV